MKKRLCTNRVLSSVLGVAMALSLLVTPMQADAAGSGYVTKLSVSKKCVMLNSGEKMQLTAKVTAKNSASKKITVSSTDKEVAKVSVKTGRTMSKSTITITAKQRGSATIKVSTSGKTTKGKKLSKKIKVTVCGTPLYNHTCLKSYLMDYCPRNSAGQPCLTYKYHGNTYMDIYDTSTRKCNFVSNLVKEKGSAITKQNYQMISNGDSKLVELNVTMTMEDTGKSEFCKAHATVDTSTYTKNTNINFVFDNVDCSLSKATLQKQLNTGFQTSLDGWDYITKDRMGFGVHALGFVKLD